MIDLCFESCRSYKSQKYSVKCRKCHGWKEPRPRVRKLVGWKKKGVISVPVYTEGERPA